MPAFISSHLVKLHQGGDYDLIHVLPAGEFSGRDGRGPYRVDDMQALIARTNARHGDLDVVIDYDHQTMHSKENGRPAPAAGWIKEFLARDDGLWARVEWTAAARQKIEAQEYRYISPVFSHQKTGEVLLLLNAGLVNQPNLTLTAISSQDLNMTLLEQIIAALGLDATTDEAGALTAVNALQESQSTLLAGFAAMAVSAGLAEEAAPNEVLTAVQSSLASASPEPDLSEYVPMAAFEDLQGKLVALQTAASTEAGVAKIEAALQNGKLLPSMKDWAIALNSSNPEALDAFLAKAPKLAVAEKDVANKPIAENAAGALTEEQLAVCKQLNISHAEFLKNKGEV